MTANDQPLRRFGPVTTAKFEPDWDAVYKQELPRIYNYFRYRLGSNELAQDLTATTFEKAWRAANVPARPRSLFDLAPQYCPQRRRRPSAQASRRCAAGVVQEFPAPDTPHDVYARAAELQPARCTVGAIADRDRELIALKYGAQLHDPRIARQIGLSESNVGTTLHRIVTRLRAKWDE